MKRPQIFWGKLSKPGVQVSLKEEIIELEKRAEKASEGRRQGKEIFS
jgi:hypothetical protein